MLADLHQRARQVRAEPAQALAGDLTAPRSSPWPTATPAARPSALSCTLPPPTPPTLAIATHADEREAQIREVEQVRRQPPGRASDDRRNRQAIAARETWVATRLRAVEHAYRTRSAHSMYEPPEPTRSSAPWTMWPTGKSTSRPSDDRQPVTINAGRSGNHALTVDQYPAQNAYWDLHLLTPDDVCALLKVKKSWLYDAVENGELRPSGGASNFGSVHRALSVTWRRREHGE